MRTATSAPVSFPSYHGEPIATGSGEEVEIRAVPADAIDPHTISLSRTPLWAVARRQLCEARDRLKPVFDRLRPKKSENGKQKAGPVK
jgi:hypothetical protein